MALDYLFDRQRQMKVVLLYTPSNSMSLFVQDAIKNRYNINKNDIMVINTKKELNSTKDIYGIVPFLSDRWLFNVKQADKLIKKDFINLVRDNTSGVYLLEFENYRNYKFTKDLLTREQGVVDLYLAWLRRSDFQTLYNRIVVYNKGYELPKTLLDFVSKGYSSEIEEIFKLFEELKSGKEVKTRKDIIEICGLSSNTIDSFMFSLLKDPTTSDRGLKKYISNRLVEAVDLAEKYTWSKFRNYLKATVKSCIDVKMILSSGEVYDNIRNYSNEGYNTKQLARYQRYLPRIKQLSITRLLGLLENLDKTPWRSDTDFLTFFFNYILYKYEANTELREMLIRTLNEKGDSKDKVKAKEPKTKSNKSTPKEDVTKLEKGRMKTRSFFSDKLTQSGGS